MKRLLVVLVLSMVVLAVVAAPAYAYKDPLGASTAATAPTVATSHTGIVGTVHTGGRTVPAGVVIRGRGLSYGVLTANHAASGVTIAALLVVVIGGAAYAIVAGRRQSARVVSGSEPARFPAHKPAPGQVHKAA